MAFALWVRCPVGKKARARRRHQMITNCALSLFNETFHSCSTL
jgi:hypothetical protein